MTDKKVYTVTIARQSKCNCPDAQKGRICKHILFIYLKVLGISQTSPLLYQKALLTEELRQIFQGAKADPAAIAKEQLRQIYEAKTSGDEAKVKELETQLKKRKEITEEDLCPVCFCNFEDADVNSNIYCQVCSNPCHKVCFEEWRKTRERQREILTCVFCRAPWPQESNVKRSSSYLNLANEAGMSDKRDSSTYYQGPRRGYRQWERYDYDDQ